MMLFEKLSEKEKDMIKCYIEDNAGNNGQSVTLSAELSYILREWAMNKNYLYNLLGGQFQISKDIEFEADYDELYNQVSILCFNANAADDVGKHAYYFYDSWFEEFVWVNRWNNNSKPDELYQIRDQLAYMLDIANLVKNVWNDASFAVPNPKNPEKPIRVSTGSKLTKMIGKIAAAYDLPYFEDFRIKHSQALNQKKLKGRLTLSIHPLDYMTMSDNECDWSSCMSWKEDGCYRQGTVEMMNSPMVLVAYLESVNNPMTVRTSDGTELWNNKKWRELFIVNDDILCEVKSYPYRNKYITIEVLKWLKELDNNLRSEHFISKMAREQEGREYEDYWSENYHAFDTYGDPVGSDYVVEHHITVKPYTKLMYNDFAGGHLGYFPRYFEKRSSTTLEFCYSGESECMICGSTGDSFEWDSEGDVMCLNCSGYTRCDRCDDRIYNEDDSYEVDGETLCESCYEYSTQEDTLTGTLHLMSNLYRLYVRVSGSGEGDKAKFYTKPLMIYDEDYDKMHSGESSFITGKIQYQKYETFYWHELGFIDLNQLKPETIAKIVENTDVYWAVERGDVNADNPEEVMNSYSDGYTEDVFHLYAD